MSQVSPSNDKRSRSSYPELSFSQNRLGHHLLGDEDGEDKGLESVVHVEA